MASVNKVILVGNLGADPETKSFRDGSKVTNMRIATSEAWKDRDSGERQERTEWHTIAIFGPLADVAANYLRKGSKVYVEGQLRTRKWQDQGGVDRYSTEVVLHGPRAVLVMLDSRDGGNSQGGQSAQRGERKKPYSDSRDAGGGGSSAWGGNDDLDDEIPF